MQNLGGSNMVNGICKYCKLKTCESSGYHCGGCPPKLTKLLEILEKGILSPDCNVDFLMATIHITEDELCFITEKYFGCSPKRLIENLKLEIAIKAINDENTIVEIVIDSGYSSIDAFRKAFKRRFKIKFEHLKNILSEPQKKDKIKNDLINGLWTTFTTKL